ncbi:Uncharacterized zinc-type alcohol dehydrogenase-like protein YahK [Serratia marcescens]|uniref:Uncharacterized zinc-type alcohol dehydrogenase-like protein YahK n=1 Tax=Serratia marcescens TaxID=615 RepID=A0A379YED4_SERMA|nr:Uncharacterized zinc-type alcohol dehydrogenase-like protein YahK [Serratia marcescens]
MNITHAYAAHDAKSALVPFDYQPRALRDHDVQIQVLFCGVCHSDLHQARNEWSNTIYPVVPGHEIVGRVSAVGDHGLALPGQRSGRRRLHGGFLPQLPELR